MYLALAGENCRAEVVWEDITLQDECDGAKAKLYNAQAEKIEREISV